MEKLNIGLFNDSFPPTIDGVANVTVNYAEIINEKYGRATVATPYYPKVTDEYPFEVVRYPSAYINKNIGYRAGMPFDPVTISKLANKQFDIIHAHCPFVSTLLARTLRAQTRTPLVFTYHTKFDIDIDKAMASDFMRRASIKMILNNINACDEVWVVSNGAGENLRSLGYTGEYIVMENGTDFSRGRSEEEKVKDLMSTLGIGEGYTVFLFVGRLMWYKGIKLSIDGIAEAKRKGAKAKFIIVGDGADAKDIKAYVKKSGLENECIFTGAIKERETLRTYFSLADLFLFPSTFDTNGIVVREAAACYCPSLLIKNSCAAEGIRHMDTGILIDENIAAMTDAIMLACSEKSLMKKIGESAADKIYLSWDEAVKRACERYSVIKEKYSAAPKKEPSLDEDLNAAIEYFVDQVEIARLYVKEMFWDTKDWMDKLLNSTDEQLREFFRQKK